MSILLAGNMLRLSKRRREGGRMARGETKCGRHIQ